MKRSADAKDATQQRLLWAAGREFRTHGFGGVGVDAVAKEAGVTSGAFYAHFESKAAIFRAALVRGLDELRTGVGEFQRRNGSRWLRRFATWYLSEERRTDLAGSCALPTLTLEAARSDEETRSAYDDRLRAVLAELEAGLGGRHKGSDAVAILALLCGGMSMAHAVRDRELSAKIARAVGAAVGAIGERHTKTPRIRNE